MLPGTAARIANRSFPACALRWAISVVHSGMFREESRWGVARGYLPRPAGTGGYHQAGERLVPVSIPERRCAPRVFDAAEGPCADTATAVLFRLISVGCEVG